MWHAITDLARRHGIPLEGKAEDWWPASAPQFGHLSHAAAEWWVAEDPGSGDLLGYARSIERGDLFELTEFFVLPDRQSAGVGRALLARAFPLGRGGVRAIIATTDTRAMTRYYGAGTAARFPMLTFEGAPAAGAGSGRLEAVQLEPTGVALAEMTAVELAVLGHARGQGELRWLLGEREGYLYRRDGASAGFGFVGRHGAGPVAALEPGDLPEQLLHLEARAAALGVERLSLQVPGPNEVAVKHLLGRGFRIDPWVNLLMTSQPFGQFDRFIAFGPPMFL
jgi:GNAT superfamily N-acetyltransferase